MITHLRIRNVALIDAVEVDLGEGLNILSGETGAGKSIIVDSINFMLGERPARDFLRDGADSASVEGIVEIRDGALRAALLELEVQPADGQLMLQRSLSAQGKSTCKVNGRTVTVGMLKDISALLVDVHGQHEHQSLLNVKKQLTMLDMFCGEPLDISKRELEILLKQYRENGKAIKDLAGFGSERAQRMEMWKFQAEEIGRAKLLPNEEEVMLNRRTRLSALERLSRDTSEALALLAGGEEGESASDQVNRAFTLLTDIGKLDTARAGLAESLAEASVILSDVSSDLRAYMEELDADPLELERVEARLDTIYRLKKKYGGTVADALIHYEDVKNKLAKLESSEADLVKLNAARKELAQKITHVCGHMSGIRKKEALAIQERVTEVLHDLGMNHARFEIEITQKKIFGPEGNDQVLFMLSPNPGEPLKPLSRIASGGEMSRIMLAIKTVLADADRIETLIFDEIDAGISGRTAQQVAEKLMGIARGRQILCITHLPQIAAMANHHFLIEKKTDSERTVTSVRAQSADEIIQELARLTGGAQITEATLNAAKEMKQQADALKKEISSTSSEIMNKLGNTR